MYFCLLLLLLLFIIIRHSSTVKDVSSMPGLVLAQKKGDGEGEFLVGMATPSVESYIVQFWACVTAFSSPCAQKKEGSDWIETFRSR